MPPNLLPGFYQIVSLNEGNPPTSVNVDGRKRILIIRQPVHLNGNVTHWQIKKEGRDTYRLSLGGYPYTVVIDDKVTVSRIDGENLEWRATYRELQDAYTIEPIGGQSKGGWTVADDSADAKIVIRPIKAQTSEPPRFSTAQLFKFAEIGE